eukprot:CAMPEP_0171078058 /NCGR_PEP_ID=MMETSP0766_2-20121228/14416_1 /TAXON_ID=439317 /ORGANISM="Gambierdiscus australes, Strain CAWD 149" /LENGTH=240 /DNA_ID=CAMNT_0011535159 /DNA_START=23 /DNA_END=742 /DNA_ORIENTATION=-
MAMQLPTGASPVLITQPLHTAQPAAAQIWPPPRATCADQSCTWPVARRGLAAVALLAAHTGRRRGGVVARAFEDEIGVQPPLGFWDPLGLSADGDVADFRRRREAELKNGRVAMYATIGYIMPEYFKWPGFLSPSLDLAFEDIPNGLAALNTVPVEGWLQIIAWCGFFEIVVNQPQNPTEPGNYYRGRYGIFVGRFIPDKALRRDKLNVEMANGRLAMVAIMGMMFQNGVAGNTGAAMWL